MSDISITRPEPPESNPNPETNQPDAAPPSGPLGFLLRVLDVPTLCILAVAWVFLLFYFFAKGGFLRGLGALLLFSVLAPVAATIGNFLRKALKPTAVFTSEGFWGLLKVKVFWAIGPQCVGIAIAFALASLVVPSEGERRTKEYTEHSQRIGQETREREEQENEAMARLLRDPAAQPELTAELYTRLAARNQAFRESLPKPDELETSEQYRERVQSATSQRIKEAERDGFRDGNLYFMPAVASITSISYRADSQELRVSFGLSKSEEMLELGRLSLVDGTDLGRVDGLRLFDHILPQKGYGGGFELEGIDTATARDIRDHLGTLSDLSAIKPNVVIDGVWRLEIQTDLDYRLGYRHPKATLTLHALVVSTRD